MGYLQMTRNVESIFGAVVTAPHQIPYTYTATGGEKFISLPFYPVTGIVTINGGMQVPLDNFEIDGNTLNLGCALSKGDVVFCLFDKILSPEDYKTGIRIYKFQAIGGETEFTPDYTSYGVQSLYIGGEYKTPEIEYSYDSTTGKVSLQTALTAGVWVVAEMSVKQSNISPLFDRSIQEIARSANVKDSEVILSTDTTQPLNGKKIIYSVSEQKTYGLPALPPNVYIHSVANGKLTYNPGSIEVNLLPVPDTALDAVNALLASLSGISGYSYIGTLPSIADLAGLFPEGAGRVKVDSWYAGWAATTNGMPNGGGDFIYMPDLDKTKHDGCVFFSPTVPYDTNLSNYVRGVGETDPTGKGVWVRDISGYTHIHTDWAGINDGATATSESAHADAMQKVFNAAAALGKHVQLGYGFIHLEKAVSLPAFYDNAYALPRIEGYGINSSYLICTPLGTDTYNLTCKLSSGNTQTWGLKDFQIREKGLTKTGYLMQIGPTITGAIIERVKFAGGYQQLLAKGVLSNTFIECVWFSGYRGAKFIDGNPNANRLIRCQILSMENQGLWIVNATEFQIIGGSMEGCGAPGDTSFRGIYVQGGGSDGSVGLVVDGLYTETCSGYPFYITHSNNKSIKHVIANSVFNNNATQYPVSQVIVLGGNYAYPSGVTMTLEMRGNMVMSAGYTGSASRPDVNIVGYAADQAIFLDYDNQWIPLQPPVLDPTVKWKVSPDFAFSAGVSAVSGTLTNRRNVTSIAKGSTGVFTLTANHNIHNVAVALTTIGTPGYAILGAEPSSNTLVVRTYNTSGAPADIDFHVTGLSYSSKFNGA